MFYYGEPGATDTANGKHSKDHYKSIVKAINDNIDDNELPDTAIFSHRDRNQERDFVWTKCESYEVMMQCIAMGAPEGTEDEVVEDYFHDDEGIFDYRKFQDWLQLAKDGSYFGDGVPKAYPDIWQNPPRWELDEEEE